MENRIREAFGCVRADEALLQATMGSLREAVAVERAAPRRPAARRAFAAVAAALVLAVGISGYRLYQAPGAYVSIDVNPSVELAVNRWDRVVGTYAFNQEGQQILDGVSLRGKGYDEAVGDILSAINREGYLTDGALVSLGIQSASREKEAELGGALADAVESRLQAHHVAAEVEVLAVSRQVWEEAHGCRMSPARYLAIQELLEVDDEATLEEYSHHSISQIRSRTRQCREGHASGGGEGRGNGGRHHGR